MRAVVFQGAGKPLRVETVPDPVPAAADVVIEVAHCGICGSDLHLAEHGFSPPGTIFGHEFAGTIAAVGSEVVGHWQMGERVTALPLFACHHCEMCDEGLPGLCPAVRFSGVSPAAQGGYARFVVAQATTLQRIPAGISFEVGAMIEPLAVAHHAVQFAQLRAAESVLILGGGPIALGAALFARRGVAGGSGARHVVVSEPAAERRACALEMGATAVIDPSTEDVLAGFVAITGGAPNAVIECVGKPGLIQQAIAAVRPRGRIVVAGVCFVDDRFNPVSALGKEVHIQFSQCYSERDFQAVIDSIAAGRVNPVPMHTRTVTLSQAPEAFAALGDAPRESKVLVSPAG
jgi:(R,R)-butanediol dehydrogenase/meso-butanediol dehydrogenase/diacetyl reductase